MGLFKKTSGATATAPINNLQVNESTNGKLIPIAHGTPRVPMWLIWNSDFKVIETTKNQGGGLFGLSGGNKSTTESYQTAFQAGLCYGPVTSIANIWNGAGKVSAIFVDTVTVGGGGITHNPTPPGGGGVKGVLAVTFTQAFSQTISDFGAPTSTVLSGTMSAPMVQVSSSPGAGQYSVNATTNAVTLGAASAGLAVQITYTADFQVFTSQETDTIPSGGTITVPNATEYVADGGVNLIDPITFAQTPMVKVASSPTTGQYTVNVSTATYSFATADHFKPVLISWQQKDPTANDASAILDLSFSNGVEGQAPWTYLSSNHPDAAIGYSGIATVQASVLQLGDNAGMPQLNYELIGPMRASGDTPLQAGGNIDCNPSDVLYDYLTNNVFGINFPTANIEWILTPANFQTSSIFAFAPVINFPGYNASAFWAANNYFISPYIDNQTTVSAQFAKILEAGQTAVIWSEGLLKLRPYGDTSAAGNGFGYVPMTQPVFDLGIDDFVANAGEEPITVNRDAWSGKYNICKVEFSNRLDDYNADTLQEEDLASVQAYGKREEDPQDCSDFIRASWVAQWVCKMRSQRLSNIRSTYNFTLPFFYGILEPMDIVTITYVGKGFSFNKLPVRITKIENDRKTGLKITAEDFPYGVAKATLYPKQTNLDAAPAPTLQAPGNATPAILELPSLMTGFDGFKYRIYATPTTPEAWGGAQVYLSGDNSEYDLQGAITIPAWTGVLSGAMDAANLIPDPVNTSGSWGGNAIFTFIPGTSSPLGNGVFSYTGTGAASSFGVKESGTITVTPSSIYTVSGYIDGTHVTSNNAGGGVFWGVYDPTLTTQYAAAFQAVGQKGWVSATFTVPTGVTSVRVICDTDNCIVASVQPLICSDPQLMHTLSIVCDNNLQLLPQSDFNFATTDEDSLLAIVDASGSYEIVSYHDAVLTGVNTYQIGNFQRGLFGTTAGAHLTGVKVVKMNQGHLEQTYPASLVGTTNFCKLTSFNTVGAREQDINSVSPLAFTFTGAFPGFFDQTTGDVFNSKFVRNGGFEAGDHDWIKGTTFTIVADPTNAYAGTYVAKSTGAGVFALTNSLLVPVQPGSVYTANCMVKVASGTASGQVTINWIAQNGTALSSPFGNSINSSTYQNSRLQSTAPANAWYASVGCQASALGVGIVYFDAVEMEDITQNVSTSLNGQGSILPNQGVLVNYAFPSTSTLITTWAAQSLLRADSSSFTLNASSGTNILIDGDGESGTLGSQATGWTFIGGNGLLIANDFVNSGTKSLKINNGATRANSLSSQSVAVTGGVIWVLEAWIKTDALPVTTPDDSALLNTSLSTGTATVLTKFGAFDDGQVISIGIKANAAAHPFTFLQCYFIPSVNATLTVGCQLLSSNGAAWFDDVKVYPFNGAMYTGLSASTTYYLYPYVDLATGNLKFANGNPPTTSPSDTFAMSAQLDGRVPMAVIKPTSPAVPPPPGGGVGGTGGGFGSCPESNELVDVQRYSDSGQLIFAGQIKAGQVGHGYESDDGRIKRGDFLKGYSFKKGADVYRAVQKVMLVPCSGWSMVNAHRVTCCEHVYVSGQWMPAWKAPGATHDSFIGYKVLIQVEADWDDEHNYYVGDLLIHNFLVLGC
jgi:hypothetical protein